MGKREDIAPFNFEGASDPPPPLGDGAMDSEDVQPEDIEQSGKDVKDHPKKLRRCRTGPCLCAMM